MELRQLRNFVTVARLENFSRAAEVLHVAQPALSQQTAALEAELGVSLFERRGRGVTLTPAGRAYLEGAERTLEAAESATVEARAAAAGKSGVLRIGFVPGAIMSVLPAVLREFRRANPHVEVLPHALTYMEQVEQLHAHRIDIGIMRVPRIDSGIHAELLLRESFVAVLPDGSPLLDLDRPLTTTDLAAEPLVLYARSADPNLTMEILRVCEAGGYRPSQIIEAAEEETVIGLVAAGFGATIVPQSWSVLAIPGAHVRPLQSDAQIDVSVCWNGENEFVDAFLAAANVAKTMVA